MENSETQEKIITLGKKLANNFKAGSGDATSHWMAHYIAEQITTIEENKNDDNSSANQECFETILKLWDHQAYFPRGARPFEKFDTLFHTIERMNPDYPSPFFYNEPEADQPKLSEEAELWINVAKKLDQHSRVLIEFSFDKAFQNTVDENTKSWITAISGVTKSQEALIIQFYESKINEDEKEQRKLDKKRDDIQQRIEQLNELDSLCQMVKQDMQEQLKILNR